MNIEIKKRFDKIENTKAVKTYFKLLKKLLTKLELENNNEKIALTISNRKNRFFTFNLNNILAFSINQHSYIFVVNDDDLEILKKKYDFEITFSFKEKKSKVKSSLIQISYKQILENPDFIFSYILKSCIFHKENHSKSRYRNAHIDEIYKIAFDDKLYLDYVNKDIRILSILEDYKTYQKEVGNKAEIYKWKLIKKFHQKPRINSEEFQNDVLEIEYDNLIYQNPKSTLKQMAQKEPLKLENIFIKMFSVKIDESILKELISELNKLFDTIKLKPNHSGGQDERSIATYLAFFNGNKYPLYKNSFYEAYCKHININYKKVKGEKYPHYILLLSDLIENYIKTDKELLEIYKNNLPKDVFQDENYLLLAQDILYLYFDGAISKKLMEKTTKEPLNIKEQFAEWLLKFMKPSYNNYLGDNKSSILEKLEEINSFFIEQDIFDVDTSNFKNVIDFILKKTGQPENLKDTPYNSYNKKNSNGIPSAVIGKFHYIKFLNEKFNKNLAEKPISNFKNNMNPLNQILYGPPGTGKTYHTINKALSIIEDKTEKELNLEDRKNLLERFNQYKKSGQIVFTTFHQSMGYEDFVEGIKPKTVDNEVIYETENGIFKDLCENAKIKKRTNFNVVYDKLIEDLNSQEDEILDLVTTKGKKFKLKPNSNNNLDVFSGDFIKKQGAISKKGLTRHYHFKDYYKGWIGYATSLIDYLEKKYNLNSEKAIIKSNYILIIDEINRGNVSSIFGELITLLEKDKRAGNKEALSVKLPYSNEDFSVPNNLFIIGTMNTADRSVEALDTALRRRFSFQEMMPLYNLSKIGKVEGIDLNKVLETINKRIEVLIDRDHTIGHSYFIDIETPKQLKNAFKDKIIPLLQEYFYGDYGKIGLVLGNGFVAEIPRQKDVFATFYYPNQDNLISASFQLKKMKKSTIISAVKTLLKQESE